MPFREHMVSPVRIVWRPQSVNIGGGLWWGCCLFVFVLHIPRKVSVNERLGCFFLDTEQSWGEAPGSPPALCYTEFSQRVQERLLLFPSFWDLNTSTTQRLSGNLFLVCYIAKSAFTNKETNPISTDKWIHPFNILLRSIWEHSNS